MAQLFNRCIDLDENSLEQVNSSETMKDEVFLSREEMIKISHHRTISSESIDTLGHDGDGIQQCCVCGQPTLDRCPHCKWAAYCSKQCSDLHQPVHKFFCHPHYALLYPRLMGLTITPMLQAAVEVEALQICQCDNEVRVGSVVGDIGSTLSDREHLTSGNSKVIQLIRRRSEIVDQNLKKASGKPACAICGDLCSPSETRNGNLDEWVPSGGAGELDDSKATTATSIRPRASYGDTTVRGSQAVELPNRLIRFAGLLLCMVCVEIQATKAN